MNDESRRILDLLAQGKITVDEAQQLLSAIQAQSADSGSTAAPAGDSTGDTQRPRFLRIAFGLQIQRRKLQYPFTCRQVGKIGRSSSMQSGVFRA